MNNVSSYFFTSRAERGWVLRFALLGMLLTTVPYLWGFASQGQDWVFTGFVFAVEDGNSYIAKMLGGAAGAWLFRTPYTAAPQRGVLAFFPYILLGKLTAGPAQHLQLVALFHVYRLIAGVLAILATYDFIAFFVREVWLRRLGVALAAFGGGLGWLLVLLGRGDWLGSLPLDFYSPETFGFLALYGLPHLAVARALLLWGLLAYLGGGGRGPRAGGWWPAVGAGFLWLLMGLFQPLTVVVAWAVVGAHLAGLGMATVWRGRGEGRVDWGQWAGYLKRGLVAGLVSAPIVVYTLWAFSTDPFLRTWRAQNLILSPHPLHYLAAYGLALPFAGVGIWRLLRARPVQGWLPVAWVVVLPVLAYAPYTLQRRLPEGVWVAWVVLVVSGVGWVGAVCGVRGAGWRVSEGGTSESVVHRSPFTTPCSLLLAPFFLTTLFLLAGGVLTARRPALPAFRPSGEVAAFRALAQQAAAGEVVLAAFETGNALPAWAPLRVVIGHGPESVHLAELRPRVAAFFQPATPDQARRGLLDEFGVRYVFWGPAERALGSWDPHTAGFLEVVYEAEGYAVFEVRR